VYLLSLDRRVLTLHVILMSVSVRMIYYNMNTCDLPLLNASSCDNASSSDAPSSHRR
jgi:hypothetical protein